MAWSLGPIVIGVVTSLSSQRDVRAVPARWVPHELTTEAYRQLLLGTSGGRAGGTVTEAGVFSHAMLVSTEVAAMATALILIVSTMAAYAFGRLRFRLGRTLFYAVLATMLVPVFVVAVTLFQVMADLHLIDTKRGLTLVFLATLSPLATWLLYNHVREMDTGPEEAALVDGCTALAGVRARRRAADGLGHRSRRGHRRALGLGRVPDPPAAHVDLELQAGHRADHGVRGQVHDELPDPRGGRRARAAAARTARPVPQPAHQQRDGGIVVSAIRPCRDDERAAILEIVNAAAEAYRGVIPADRWHEPYMGADELAGEIASGVAFWGYESGAELTGVMGIQPVGDVDLIRHAYVRPGHQGRGIGGALLEHLRGLTQRRMLVGTWAAAEWAIGFYLRNGFELVTPEQKTRLLTTYWNIPERQIETSVVLANPPLAVS